MRWSTCDYVTAALILIVLGVWQTMPTFKYYEDLHRIMSSLDSKLPKMLFNPLDALASVLVKPSPELPGDEIDIPVDEEEEDTSEDDKTDEDEDEESETPSSWDIKTPEFLLEKVAAAKKGQVMMLERTALDWSLKKSKDMLVGEISGSQALVYDTTIMEPPFKLLDINSMDEYESIFLEQLEKEVASLEAVLDQVDRAAFGRSESSDDPIWTANSDAHDEWLKSETEIILESIRQANKTTLSGYSLQDVDIFFSNSATGFENHATVEKEVLPDEESVAVIRHSSEEHNNGYDAATLLNIEKELSFWAHASSKSVLAFGNNNYIQRDLATYEYGFKKAGFSVARNKKEGALSVKVMESNTFAVLLCLALKNDHCFTINGVNKMARHQKINRIPGLRAVLWSKDSFCNTVSTGVKGVEPFTSYVFNCWLLPDEWLSVKDYGNSRPEVTFIVKPLTMGGGLGITVVDSVKQLSKMRFQTHLVQNYLSNPHLINQRKWDMRTYVLVTSSVPMRAYVYNKGIVRFATAKYDPNAKHGGKKSQYLTNTSINKKYAGDNVTSITKSFAELSIELNALGRSFDDLFEEMRMAISVVFLSAEFEWDRYFHKHSIDCPSCYQLLGVDLIVDSEMKPKVIEVNGQPSMQLSSGKPNEYTKTKKEMISDLIGLIYTTDSVAESLALKLNEVDETALAGLSKHHMEYIVEYYSEKGNLGGFKPVYPNPKNAKIHSVFLEQQTKITPSRLVLHDVLMLL